MNWLQRIRQALFRPSEQPLPDAVSPQDDALRFGVESLDPREATGGFLLVGAPGSGKSTLLNALLRSALRWVGVRPDQRAIIYDAKQNMLPLLHALAPQARIVTLNPWDKRGAAWSICDDVREPRIAVEIAFTLIPSIHESQPFFSDAARHLLYGVMLSFMLSEVDWTLGDVIRALSNPRLLKRVLCRHPQTKSIVARYFYDRKLVANIMSTIATKLLPLEPVAAAWEAATTRISIDEWATSDLILVLGNSDSSRTAMNAINRCISKRAFDLTLNLPDSFERRSYFVYDELGEAGKLDGILSLAKRGRSGGAVLMASVQSVCSLRDAQMYGPHLADELLGLFANRFIGRLECPVTAEWASSLFGDQEIEQTSTSVSQSPQGRSHTESRQKAIRKSALPSELMNTPTCTPEDGLSGYYILRSKGCFVATIPGEELFGDAMVRPDPSVPEFVPRDRWCQLLRPWTKAEKEKFAGPQPQPRKPAKGKRPSPPSTLRFDPWDLADDLGPLDGHPDHDMPEPPESLP
ncbi:MAG: type IV secretion system DNA-binding domain-containing protein [Pirellulales bacterium]|nr:type IV secretion system DNA-binding domain-containing protein [Pirellulales bacterium]